MKNFLDITINNLTVRYRLKNNAIVMVFPESMEVGVPMDYMQEIAKWCKEENCGRFIGHDTFNFETDEQLTHFLLKWSSD